MDFGGVTGGFQTPMNTIGIGDPVPFGGPAGVGSGDLFGSKKQKRSKKNTGIATKQGPQCQLGVNLEYRPLIVMADDKKK